VVWNPDQIFKKSERGRLSREKSPFCFVRSIPLGYALEHLDDLPMATVNFRDINLLSESAPSRREKDWTHEFQRPIYFPMTREGYVCGLCELDENSEWLTLVPNPLSPASSRRWK
jgi:hypothetical protein